MKDIVVVGAGKIGSMIAELLGGCGDYAVTVIDRSQQQLDRLETSVPVTKIAAGARTAFIPQCGLAPGFVTIVAADLASHFEELQDVRMRVGALPKFPSNALNYNLTWSTDGVINEYCEPCEAIVNGQLRETQPLEELEEFSLDGVLYEA